MNSSFKVLSTLFLLLLGTAGVCYANAPTSVIPSLKNEDTAPCNEPAPINFQITEISTNRIKVAWNLPVNIPFEYNIKVFETVSGLLVQSFNIPGISTIARGTNLQPQTQYTIRCTPVCPDGTLSHYFSDGTGTTLIIELVNSGFSPSTSSMTCMIDDKDEYCVANPSQGNIVTFKIRPTAYPSQGRYFGVYNADNQCESTKIKVHPANSSYQFYCDVSEDPDCYAERVIVKLNGAQVAEFSISTLTTTNKHIFCSADAASGYEIVRFGSATGTYDPSGGECGEGEEEEGRPGKPRGRERDAWEDPLPVALLTASPNPFSHELDVRINFAPSANDTDISLYDLQGRQVVNLVVPNEQRDVRIKSDDLLPGIYFLRAVCGEVYQTVKVVKTP